MTTFDQAKKYFYGSKFSDDVELIADLGGGTYDWSVIAVFRQNQDFFYGMDSGCSCNGPFEDESEVDMIELNPYNMKEFNDHVTAFASDSMDSDERAGLPEFLFRVTKALPKIEE